MWKMLIEDGKENVMGKIEGIKIKNYGPIREVVLGRTLSHQKPEPLGNMITIIGPSGNGKSTLADAFGFIADCLELGLEAACDANNRGGYDQLISQGVKEPISFEIYYERTKIRHPSHMNWRLTKINMNGRMSKWSD
jgi:AAA15 family ATPase/GTPase